MDSIVNILVIAGLLFVVILFIIASSVNDTSMDKEDEKAFTSAPKRKNFKGAV